MTSSTQWLDRQRHRNDPGASWRIGVTRLLAVDFFPDRQKSERKEMHAEAPNVSNREAFSFCWPRRRRTAISLTFWTRGTWTARSTRSSVPMKRTATATSLTREARATGTPDLSQVAVAGIRPSPAGTGMDRHG